jgi:hypothetical protein
MVPHEYSTGLLSAMLAGSPALGREPSNSKFRFPE